MLAQINKKFPQLVGECKAVRAKKFPPHLSVQYRFCRSNKVQHELKVDSDNFMKLFYVFEIVRK